MKQHLLRFLFLAAFQFSYSQQKPATTKFTLSGIIKSKAKGETLIGASIRAGNTGTLSNEYGFYSITLEKGNYSVEFSAIGLQLSTQEIILDKDIRLDISLGDEVKSLEGVIVICTIERTKYQQSANGC